MADLPQHAAQIATFMNLQDEGFSHNSLFEINLFTPYLVGYVLILALTPLFGIVMACKTIIGVALAAFPLATRYYLQEVGANPKLSWLCFPALYGFAYQWGFVNYIVAAPLGLLLLGLIARQKKHLSICSSVAITLTLLFLFISHVLIFAFFSVIASAIWLNNYRRPLDFIKHAWPLAALAPIAVLWLYLRSAHPITANSNQWDLSWFISKEAYYAAFASWITPGAADWGRLTGLIPRMLGERPSNASLFFGALLFALPFLTGHRLSRCTDRVAPLIICTLILFLAPSFIFGTAFIFQRYTLFFMPLYLGIFNFSNTKNRHTPPWLHHLPPVLALFWISLSTLNSLRFNQETLEFTPVLQRMETGKRVLSLMFERDDDMSIAPTVIHLPSWYAALSAGVADPNFAETQIQPVRYKMVNKDSAMLLGMEWSPRKFSWGKYHGDQYDYFLVKSPADYSKRLFSTATCPIQLIIQSGSWRLYKKGAPCSSAKK